MLRRFGIFRISDELLHREPEAIMGHLFARVVVLRCEHMYADRQFEYVALSPMFAEVPEGVEIPRYDIVFGRGHGAEITVEAIREVPLYQRMSGANMASQSDTVVIAVDRSAGSQEADIISAGGE